MSELTGDWSKINSIFNPSKLRASMRQCAARVGNYGASEIKKGIVSGAPAGKPFKPLSTLTTSRKGSSKPLIDKGDLVGSITYQVLSDSDSVFIGVKKGKEANIAAVHEFGCTIAVTPKMRAYLHHKGIHLKAETTHIHIPARPFLMPVLLSPNFQNRVGEIYIEALRKAFTP